MANITDNEKMAEGDSGGVASGRGTNVFLPKGRLNEEVMDRRLFCLTSKMLYRDRLKRWYVVARSLFLLLITCSAWPCLGPA